MKILAVDGASAAASAAVVEDDILVAEYTINYKMTHSTTLLPMIDNMTKSIGLDMEDVDAFAVTKGPGSYTGLRIAGATVKGFGLAVKKPIVPVPTMDAMAYNLVSSGCLVCPIMDARRKQVYTGIYSFLGDDMHIVMSQRVMIIEDLISRLDEIGKKVMFLGDAAKVDYEIIEKNMKTEHYYAPASVNRSKASSLAVLASKYYREGKFVSATQYAPDYLMLPQAEKELKERQKHEGREINDN